MQLTNAPPPSGTEHKPRPSPPPVNAPASVAVVSGSEPPSGTTLSRRSQGGIGGFLSSLFEADYSKWLKELPQQKDPKTFAFEQLRHGMSNPDHTLGRPVEAFAVTVPLHSNGIASSIST